MRPSALLDEARHEPAIIPRSRQNACRKQATLLGFTLFLLAHAPVLTQSQKPDLQDYAERARHAVKQYRQSRNEPIEQLRIELIGGEVVFPPVHAHLHRDSVAPATLALSGRVVNYQWKPIAGAKISIFTDSAKKEARSAVSDSNGEFKVLVPEQPPGGYRIRAEAGGFPPADIALAAGGHRFIVRLSNEPRSHGVFYLFGPGRGLRNHRDSLRTLHPRALMAVYRGEKIINYYQVEFNGGQAPDVRHAGSDDDFRETITESQRRNVSRQLAPFFEALLDVSRGPERFRPFLGDKATCLFFSSGTPVLPSDARQCPAWMLEVLAFGAWLSLESGGDGGDDLIQEILWCEPGPCTDWTQRHRFIRNELRAAGMLDVPHRVAIYPYLRRLMNEGAVSPWFGVEGELQLARALGLELYALRHSNVVVFLFARQGASLRLVGIIGSWG